jgi:hypothetical protein
MKFARYTFAAAAIYGILALAPQYFLENRIGENDPPAITHPEFFYGFIGVALAFQVVFLIIAKDPVRYRLMMIAAVLEKFSFGIAAAALYLQNRLSGEMMAAGAIDLLLGILFLVSFVKTPGSADP